MSEKIATRQAYSEELAKLGEKYSEIVVLDADLSTSTGTAKFAKKFPERFFDMGIAEQNMISTAAGLACAGKTVFASSFAMFASGRAWEQIRNSVAHNDFNVKIAATHAGITLGQDGASHQAIEDIAIMSVIPKMTVLVPADANETKAMLRALIKHKGPCYLRLGRHPLPIIFDENFVFEIGKAQVLKQGTDITIISVGVMTSIALEAVEKLKEENISAEVINLSSIKPLDKETIINSLKKTKAVIVAEEHNEVCGVNHMIGALISKELDFFCPMETVAIKDRFGQSGTPEELLEEYGLTTKDICSQVKKLLSRKK